MLFYTFIHTIQNKNEDINHYLCYFTYRNNTATMQLKSSLLSNSMI